MSLPHFDSSVLKLIRECFSDCGKQRLYMSSIGSCDNRGVDFFAALGRNGPKDDFDKVDGRLIVQPTNVLRKTYIEIDALDLFSEQIILGKDQKDRRLSKPLRSTYLVE